MKHTLLALAAIGAFVVSTANAQQDTAKPRTVSTTSGGEVVPPKAPYIVLAISDMVTGKEVEGAEITDTLSGNVVRTAATGVVDLRSFALQSPYYPFLALRIRKPGYQPFYLSLNMAKDTTDRQVDLIPAPLGDTTVAVRLPGMVTKGDRYAHLLNAGIEGFSARRAYPGYEGIFLDSEVLRGSMLTLTDLIQQQGKPYWNKFRTCEPSIFVNGAHTFDENGNLLSLPASRYKAVEYYPHGTYTPPQFKGGACGTYVLWFDYGPSR